MNLIKTSIAGLAIAAAVSLPLVGTTAAFAGDATFPPTAVTDNYSTMQDTQLVVDAASGLLANDSSGGNSGLAVNGVTAGVGGNAVASLDGSFVFTPDAGFVGTVHLIYSDVAGGMSSNFADIFIVVTAAPTPLPVAYADSYSTPQDTPLVVDIASGLLANDTDVWQMFTQDNSVGLMAMNADGDFTFTPPAGFVGTVTFNYSAKDFNFHVSNSAVVTIEVTPAVISVIPSNPIPGNPGNPGSSDDGTDGQLETLAYTGTDDVTVWLVAPALALLAIGGIGIWFARRRAVQQ
ncbi:MAG: hypothetical protein JWR04_1615 [Rhodoglobus sp.]|jgi:hypothetical protein|nr:hypothetical protein [Rhodoglobus sp.]